MARTSHLPQLGKLLQSILGRAAPTPEFISASLLFARMPEEKRTLPPPPTASRHRLQRLAQESRAWQDIGYELSQCIGSRRVVVGLCRLLRLGTQKKSTDGVLIDVAAADVIWNLPSKKIAFENKASFRATTTPAKRKQRKKTISRYCSSPSR